MFVGALLDQFWTNEPHIISVGRICQAPIFFPILLVSSFKLKYHFHLNWSLFFKVNE